MHQPSPNDRVRLTQSIPTLWLKRGDVGSIRSVWSSEPGFYEVEFQKAEESCAVRALVEADQLEVVEVAREDDDGSTGVTP
jgi:hypothetical protein